jgi:hypothetical protein
MGRKTQKRQDVDMFDELYETYVKPVEEKHAGEYVAVGQKGQVFFGTTLREVGLTALKKFGPGTYVYKVGERVAGRMR